MFGLSFGPKSVTVHEAHEKLGTPGHVLVDVRTREEVRAQSVPGSMHISLDSLESRLHELADFTSIHVMCRSGGRSAMATSMLHEAGMTHAENVSGGISAWEAAGLPTT